MKQEGTSSTRSGRYIPGKFAEAVCNELEEMDGLDDQFVIGACAMLSFLSCPPGAEMHGKGLGEFVANASKWAEDCLGEPPAEVVSAAREAVAALERIGVRVVSASIVRGDL